ncbi:MAG TPA: protein kinase, partial [Polyangiales bacterium]|nr:protein kinase [Polyangiales bacterium]
MHETRFVDDELERAKARAKARILQRPELLPRLGRFQLRKLLGRGGNGSVYEAQDTRDGSLVAVKLLLDSHAQSILRFKSEFRRLADLAHDNLVRLLELFKEGDDWYFSMELVRGVTFREHVDGSEADAVRAGLLQLMAAVESIHAAGYLHCDLKPSNVLVEPSGRVVVLDFGLITRDGEYAHTGKRKRPGT